MQKFDATIVSHLLDLFGENGFELSGFIFVKDGLIHTLNVSGLDKSHKKVLSAMIENTNRSHEIELERRKGK